MPGFDDEHPDVAWTGRPQDDPKLIAMLEAGRAEFRHKHPPVNCWIDQVQTIELYQDGMVRAQVRPNRSLITYFDDQGQVTSTATYLRSESAFDVAEAHLGIGRVKEIRDESNEAEEPISSYPRKQSERCARAFRASCPPSDEAVHYLREAANTYQFFGGNVVPFAREWRGLIGGALDAIAANDREAAHGIVLMALSGMNQNAILDWQVAWVDCARAAEALRRDLEKERR